MNGRHTDQMGSCLAILEQDGRQAVFTVFDIEDKPTKGGIYLAPLNVPLPQLTMPLLTTLGQHWLTGSRGD